MVKISLLQTVLRGTNDKVQHFLELFKLQANRLSILSLLITEKMENFQLFPLYPEPDIQEPDEEHRTLMARVNAPDPPLRDLQDIICSCRFQQPELGITNKDLLLRINMGLLRAGLGLLCYQVEVGQTFRNGNETNSVYCCKMLPAYPQRQKFKDYPDCKCTLDIRSKLRAVWSGGSVPNSITSVCVVRPGPATSDLYSLCKVPEGEVSFPEYRRIPVSDGWTYVKLDPAMTRPTVLVDIYRAHCVVCQH